MIARLWHGMTPTAKAEDYLAFLQARAIPDYGSIPGNLAVYILRRSEGKDISRPKYYPEDKEFLIEFESTVQHFEVFAG